MEPSEYDGLWWSAADPGAQWFGTLRLDERDEARLTIHVPAEKPNPFPKLNEYELIFGRASNGALISLIDCFDKTTRGNFFGIPRRVEIFANSAIIGFHCDTVDPLVESVAVSYKHLDEWWGRSGIGAEAVPAHPSFVPTYTPSEPVVLYDDDTFRVEIRAAALGSISAWEACLREHIQFEVHASTPRGLSEFQRVTSACGDFISIVCLTFCDQTEFSIVTSPPAGGTMKQLGKFHAVPVYEDRDGHSSARAHMLFSFSDIESRATAIFGEWFSQRERLHDLRALYFSAAYGGGFIEGKLLDLTQAAEAFHRRFRHGLYVGKQAFGELLDQLKNALPAEVDDRLLTSIQGRLSHANEYTQRDRLGSLFSEHAETLRVLVDKPEDYVQRIVKHRNAFTHFPAKPTGPVAPDSPLAPDRVLLYNFLLRLLLEACFMQTMGLSVEEITGFVQRSETYRQLSRKFRTRPALPTPASPAAPDVAHCGTGDVQ